MFFSSTPASIASEKFAKFIANYAKRFEFDSKVLLLPHRPDSGQTLENAYLSSLRHANSLVTMIHERNIVYSGTIFAHEIGHQFGMAHDHQYSWKKCRTRFDKRPLMSRYNLVRGSPRNAASQGWSDCVVESFKRYLKFARPKCLQKVLLIIALDPVNCDKLDCPTCDRYKGLT